MVKLHNCMVLLILNIFYKYFKKKNFNFFYMEILFVNLNVVY